MFKLVKNEFAKDGKCWYEDEYKNTCFIKREENGFTAKLRFENKDVVAKPLRIELPLKEAELGINLDIEYKNGAKNDESFEILQGIENFTNLVQYFIGLMYSVMYYTAPNDLIMKTYPNETKESIYNKKIEGIYKYEELKELVDEVFGNNN